jgi:ABC-type glutathione transport system ATPase component
MPPREAGIVVFPLGGSRDQKSRSPQEKAPSRSSKVQCGEKKGCRYRRSVADHSIVRVARLPPVFSDLRFMRLFIFGCCMGERRANMDFSPREPDSWDVPPGEPAAGKASAFLRLEAISKTYSARDGKPVRALDEISCEIRLGEFISILGPSRYRPSPTGRDSRDHEHQTVRSTPCPPG